MGSGAPWEPAENDSNYHFIMANRTTDMSQLSELKANIGSRSYNLSGGSGGLMNGDTSYILNFSDGSIAVDFNNETFDVQLNFTDGSELFTVNADIMNLFFADLVELEGAGAFSSGSFAGVFAGENAEAIIALIQAFLDDNGELLRGSGLFD